MRLHEHAHGRTARRAPEVGVLLDELPGRGEELGCGRWPKARGNGIEEPSVPVVATNAGLRVVGKVLCTVIDELVNVRLVVGGTVFAHDARYDPESQRFCLRQQRVGALGIGRGIGREGGDAVRHHVLEEGPGLGPGVFRSQALATGTRRPCGRAAACSKRFLEREGIVLQPGEELASKCANHSFLREVHVRIQESGQEEKWVAFPILQGDPPPCVDVWVCSLGTVSCVMDYLLHEAAAVYNEGAVVVEVHRILLALGYGSAAANAVEGIEVGVEGQNHSTVGRAVLAIGHGRRR